MTRLAPPVASRSGLPCLPPSTGAPRVHRAVPWEALFTSGCAEPGRGGVTEVVVDEDAVRHDVERSVTTPRRRPRDPVGAPRRLDRSA
ncbi:hypothetical protein [Actinoalloteichus caeruleus]|uniref:hypothetical protein n=1 Tax=Actinoalloteichus cyanogriseus TaxID=2893586 RepID=UPI0005569AE9|nr:hypothetical protein [Actinoalloteichus caeruleus]